MLGLYPCCRSSHFTQSWRGLKVAEDFAHKVNIADEMQPFTLSSIVSKLNNVYIIFSSYQSLLLFIVNLIPPFKLSKMFFPVPDSEVKALCDCNQYVILFCERI